MAAIDETELRFVLEGLNKDQLTSILENNGYSYKGKDDFLIRQRRFPYKTDNDQDFL